MSEVRRKVEVIVALWIDEDAGVENGVRDDGRG